MRPISNLDQNKRRLTITMSSEAVNELKVRAVKDNVTVGDYLIDKLNLEKTKDGNN